jgi:hypothetical protein
MAPNFVNKGGQQPTPQVVEFHGTKPKASTVKPVNYGLACHRRPNDSLTDYTSYIHTWTVYTLICPGPLFDVKLLWTYR